MTKIPPASDPARNVWLQLGFPDAEEHFFKAELVLRLSRAIEGRGLTQSAAARRIGTTQPELSKILRGKFSEVSLERLMRVLNALGLGIEVRIAPSTSKKCKIPGRLIQFSTIWAPCKRRRPQALARCEDLPLAQQTNGLDVPTL